MLKARFSSNQEACSSLFQMSRCWLIRELSDQFFFYNDKSILAKDSPLGSILKSDVRADLTSDNSMASSTRHKLKLNKQIIQSRVLRQIPMTREVLLHLQLHNYVEEKKHFTDHKAVSLTTKWSVFLQFASVSFESFWYIYSLYCLDIWDILLMWKMITWTIDQKKTLHSFHWLIMLIIFRKIPQRFIQSFFR